MSAVSLQQNDLRGQAVQWIMLTPSLASRLNLRLIRTLCVLISTETADSFRCCIALLAFRNCMVL